MAERAMERLAPAPLTATTLKAIPYCVWCSRKPGEMLVWLRKLPAVRQAVSHAHIAA